MRCVEEGGVRDANRERVRSIGRSFPCHPVFVLPFFHRVSQGTFLCLYFRKDESWFRDVDQRLVNGTLHQNQDFHSSCHDVLAERFRLGVVVFFWRGCTPLEVW